MSNNSTEADMGRRLKELEEAVFNLQRERSIPGSTLDNCPTGTVAGYLSPYPPQGWLPLDGGTSITADTYPSLYAYLNANGLSLTLPDFRDRVPIGAGNLYSGTSTGGTADGVVVSHLHAMADHNHGIDANTTQAEAPGVGINTITSSFENRVLVKGTAVDMATGTDGAAYNTTTVGVSATGANLPPYRGLYFMIRT